MNTLETPTEIEQSDVNEILGVVPETDPVAILKEFYLAKEAIKIAERKVEELKPLVEAIRDGESPKLVPAKLRNQAGKFKILHVETGRMIADANVVLKLWEDGVITEEQFVEAVDWCDMTHNRVTFLPGK